MWVYHSTTKDLNPSFSFAETASFSTAFEAGYIYFCTRFCKWEMMRAEFYFCLRSEQLFCKFLKRSFQVCKSNIFINDQSLDLME